MTPQTFVRNLGGRKIHVDKLIFRKPSRYFSMMVVNRTRAKNGVVCFNSMTSWNTCRETISGYVRRRAALEHGSYSEPTGIYRHGYGIPLTNLKRVKLTDVFGDGRPMCIAINSMSYAKALKAKRLLNELEALNKIKGIGRTEVLECELVSKGVKVGGFVREPFNKAGVMFVIPACWTQTIPHLSLYLLIVRSVTGKVFLRKGESFKEFWRRVSEGGARDSAGIKVIIKRCPELLEIMIKNWQTIVNKQNGIEAWQSKTGSSQGVHYLFEKVYNYVECHNKAKGTTTEKYRQLVLECSAAALREVIKYIGDTIIEKRKGLK